MRIVAVIAAVLAACGDDGSQQADPTAGGCESPSRDFAAQGALLESQIAEFVDDPGPATCYRTTTATAREDITCEDACVMAHRRSQNGGCQVAIVEISSCEFMIAPEPGATPETAVGSVSCAGTENPNGCVGRRPLGHVEVAVAGEDLRAYLVRNAHLEAAAVVAFEQLAALLSGWEAPAELVARCRVAAVQEERHAALLSGLAAQVGGVVPDVRQRPHGLDLRSVALHNAVEGCVHEAWAALCAAWMGRHAGTPELRAIFAEIAADEAEHAQLAWDLHAWFLGQVGAEAGAQIAAAQRAALARLTARAVDEVAATPAILGLPGAIAGLSGRFAAELAAAA